MKMMKKVGSDLYKANLTKVRHLEMINDGCKVILVVCNFYTISMRDGRTMSHTNFRVFLK